MSSKKSKMLLNSNNIKSNLPEKLDSVGALLSDLFATLNPGESTDIQLKRNLMIVRLYVVRKKVKH